MRRLRTIIFLNSLALLLATVSCNKETSWNSDWIVPLINDSLAIKDYVNDSTLSVNSDNSIQVILERDLLSLDLSDFIKIPDTSLHEPFTINISSINVAPGFVFVNEIRENVLKFNDAALLEARIKTGKIKIKVENPIETKAIFTISLPGVTKYGEEFQHTQTVDAGTAQNPGVANFEFDFSDYHINLRGENNDFYNILQSRLQVKSDHEGETVLITNNDIFKTTVSFENLSIDYGKGYLGKIELSDTIDTNIDFLQNIIGGNINIDDVNLQLSIRNGIRANGQGKINLFESINSQGNVVELEHPYFSQYLNLNPAQGEWEALTPSELIFTFNSSNGNLKEFLENLGHYYKVDYDIKTNPLGNTSSGNDVFYPKSKLELNLKADFPLKIGADNLVLQDTFAIDFKNDGKALRIQSGELVLKATNSFPYGTHVTLSLLNEELNVIKELTTTGQISPTGINSDNTGHQSVYEEMIFVVDEEAADLLAETEHIIVRATFNSTQFSNNVIYADALIKFILQGRFKLKAGV